MKTLQAKKKKKKKKKKLDSPRWDAAFCGVTSGAILFAYVLKEKTPGLYGLEKQ